MLLVVYVVVHESVVDEADEDVVEALEVLEVLLLDLVLDDVVGVVVVDETVLVLDEVEAVDEDAVELETFEVAAEEEEEVVVFLVEVVLVVDFEPDIATYAAPAATAITTTARIAKTAGATPFLLLTSILGEHYPQARECHDINLPDGLGYYVHSLTNR